MPVMMALRRKYGETKPLSGMRIAGCIHVTKETAVLVRTFIAAGAEVSWSGCNPLSTQDDIAAALAAEGVSIYAWNGLSVEEFYWCIERTLDFKPTLTLDDGADLIFTVHNRFPDVAKYIIGGTEETTTGVHRLRAMGNDGKLLYPVLAVNDAETKWDFDNVYGTGQSSLDGIIRSSNILLARKVFVVAGYGHCGKGLAMRARGMGAKVVVTEVKPTAALKAVMDGFDVMPMDEAARIGDIFITATGMKDVIVRRHFEVMKDCAVVCNTGHYDVELNIPDLESIAVSSREMLRLLEEQDCWEQDIPALQGPPREPRRRRGASLRGYGHELRKPVHVHAQNEERGPLHGEEGLRHFGGAGSGDCQAEAGDHGQEHRQAHP